jgi:hypothetical protein
VAYEAPSASHKMALRPSGQVGAALSGLCQAFESVQRSSVVKAMSVHGMRRRIVYR